MKKKTASAENEFNMFEAMKELEKTRGVPVTSIIENIKKSIEKACKSSLDNDDVVFMRKSEDRCRSQKIGKNLYSECEKRYQTGHQR